MCTCTHKHVCRHTYKHTNTHTCAQLPTHTQKHVCVQPHMHTCGHTNTCTCVCAHSALGQGLPQTLWKALHHLGWTSDPSSFSISSAGPPPGGCHMPVHTVCVCVPHRRTVCVGVCAPQENEQAPQTTGEGGPSVVQRFYLKSPSRLQAHSSRWARKT